MRKEYELVYKTQTTPFFPICLIAKNYTRNFFNFSGVDLIMEKPEIAVIYNKTTSWFFHKSSEVIARKALDNFLSHPKFLKKLQSQEKKISSILSKEIKTSISDLFTRGRLNSAGQKKLKYIFKNYGEYGYFLDVPGFLLQVYYEDEIKKWIKNDEILQLILSSSKETNYERFLFRIYDHIINKKKTKNLKKIERNFYWLIHDYLGKIIDMDYLNNFIKELKKKPKNELKQELRDIDLRIKKIENTRNKLPKEIIGKIKAIKEVLYLYNERKKEVLNPVNIFIRKIIQCRFPNKDFSELHNVYQLSPDEVIKLLKGAEVQKLKERESRWVYFLKNNKIYNGDKKYLSLVLNSQKKQVFRGVSVSTGKIRGTANLVFNMSQISKFKKGDILVAPFTNVNYLPIMRKAAAIITEVGGITSHAAIVSRELKIPCIVGIKSISSVLKDGDLVEVNANKGLVKMIKKK